MPKIFTLTVFVILSSATAIAQDVQPFWQPSTETVEHAAKNSDPRSEDVNKSRFMFSATAGYGMITDALVAEQGDAELFLHGGTLDLQFGIRLTKPASTIDVYLAYAPSAFFDGGLIHRHELVFGIRFSYLTVALGGGVNFLHDLDGESAVGGSFNASVSFRTKGGFTFAIPMGIDALVGGLVGQRLGLAFGFSSR